MATNIAPHSQSGKPALNRQLRLHGFTPGAELWLKINNNNIYQCLVTADGFEAWRMAKAGDEPDPKGGSKWKRDRHYPDGYAHILNRARQGDEVFFIRNHPHGGIGNGHCTDFSQVFGEIDDRPIPEQWDKLNEINRAIGIVPGVVVFSGGKSLHFYYTLKESVSPDRWRRLQRKLIILFESDPAIGNPVREMRLAGFPRTKKGTEQTLDFESDRTYTPEQFESALDSTGLFPHGLSDERWRQWRQWRVGGGGNPEKILTQPESELLPPVRTRPITEFEPTDEREFARTLLGALSPWRADDYESWLSVGMALYSIGSDMLTEWDIWSQQSPKYKPGSCDRKWKSFKSGKVTIGSLVFMAKADGWHPPKREYKPGDRTFPDTISRADWEEKFKLPEQIKGIANYIQSVFGRFARKFPKAQGFATPAKNISAPQTSSALVLWQPPLNLIPVPLQYIPGELPTPEEWVTMGRPSIEYKGGLRIPLLRELYAKNYERVWDSSFMGQGKTHDIGNLRGELFKFERDGKEVIPQIFYNAANHRNPDTATIESFADLPSRHDGLVEDKTRRTASGYAHIVRPKPDEKTSIPGNCPETKTFLILNQEKGLTVRGGKGSPICQTCPLFKNDEGKISCEFLTERWETLHTNTEIRQHLDQSSKAKADAIGIVEEVGASLKPYRLLKATKPDLACAYQELKEVGQFKLAWCTTEIRDALYKALNISDLPLFGLDFAAILAKLPSKKQIAEKIWEVYDDDWLDAKDPWSIPAPEELSDLIYKALLPKLENYIIPDHTPEEKQAFLREQVALNWISPVLDAIVENKAHLRIDAQGLHITRRTNRYKSVLANYKMLVLNDSTATASDLALLTGFKKDSILEIRQKRPNNCNLTITIIDGFGRLGQQRETEGEFCAQTRFETLLMTQIKNQHSLIGVIDHQKFVTRYPVQTGYWGRDNRGSNAFINCDALVLAGDPIPNLGQTAAEYHALTGKIVNPSKWEGGFGTWVRRHIASESVQAGARLRAHLSPSAKHLYIVGNSTDIEHWRHFFPGATIQVRHVTEICPAAAPKGLQRERDLIEVMKEFISCGLDFTQATLAEKMNLSRSRVSQIAKAICAPVGIKENCFGHLKTWLISLIDSSLRKINTPPALSAECRFIAETYLPDLLVGLSEKVEESVAFVVKELIAVRQAYGPQTFKDILDASEATPRLLGVLLRMFRPEKVPIAT